MRANILTLSHFYSVCQSRSLCFCNFSLFHLSPSIWIATSTVVQIQTNLIQFNSNSSTFLIEINWIELISIGFQILEFFVFERMLSSTYHRWRSMRIRKAFYDCFWEKALIPKWAWKCVPIGKEIPFTLKQVCILIRWPLFVITLPKLLRSLNLRRNFTISLESLRYLNWMIIIWRFWCFPFSE